jgi:hypothetical protein
MTWRIWGILLLAVALGAQAMAATDAGDEVSVEEAGSVPQEAAGAKSAGPIQDNSLLVEEAYNQEFGVVQHISALTRFAGNNWAYTFTQEWPVPGIKHQLSYTLARQNNGRGEGWGDALINYRYQLIGTGETRVAVAPRVSLVLPAGDYRRSLSGGSTGVQYQIPASVVVSKKLVTHWNVGGTYLPNARNAAGDKAFTKSYNLGQSFIWLATERVNLMLESIFTGNEDILGRDRVRRTYSAYVSPGIRWAHNFKSGLQIVPGVGVPQGVGSSAGQHGVILYLSFEHPFRRRNE